MSFLRPSAFYRVLFMHSWLEWMPCQSWGFLRWPGFDGVLRCLVVLLLWSIFAEISFIRSSSMYPTLHVQDRVLLERVTYCFKRPAIHDIVFFRSPVKIQGYSEEDIFVKRIVAKAGDWVEVRNGSLFVNGIAQNEDFILEPANYTMNLTVSSPSIPSLYFNRAKLLRQQSVFLNNITGLELPRANDSVKSQLNSPCNLYTLSLVDMKKPG